MILAKARKTTVTRTVAVLIISFLAGLCIDALAENLAAQEYYQSSSRRMIPANQETDQESMEDALQNKAFLTPELDMPIMNIRLNVVDYSERKPSDQSNELQTLNYGLNYPGTFQQRVATWCPPNIRYQPLFFEDVALERYGYHSGNFRQPVTSAIHFANSMLFFVPNAYKQNPFSCTYPLGFCRPGSTAPQIADRWLK